MEVGAFAKKTKTRKTRRDILVQGRGNRSWIIPRLATHIQPVLVVAVGGAQASAAKAHIQTFYLEVLVSRCSPNQCVLNFQSRAPTYIVTSSDEEAMSQALRRSLSREQFHVAWLAASGYFQLNQKPYSQTESLQKETCIAVHVCREHPRPTSSKPSGCDPFCPGRCCTEVRGERLNWVCPKIRHAFQTKGPTRNTQTQSLASEGCWRDSSPKARISLAASRHRSHALQSVGTGWSWHHKSSQSMHRKLHSSCTQRHSMLAPSSVASIAMAMLDGRSTGHFLYITCLDNFLLTAREDLARRPRPRALPRPAAEAAKARLICRTSSVGMLT